MRRHLVLLATAALLVGTVVPASAQGPPRMETEPISWHAQATAAGLGDGEVDGAYAHLRATDSGASVTFRTHDLQPDHAYTLWFVVVNEPEACDDEPCTAGDIFADGNPAAAQVLHGAGNIVGTSGRATFSAHLNAGDVDGWLDTVTFDDPRGAEYHFVLNDHGPRIAEHLPGMLHTYRGGCSDDSPFPGIFPETALQDGEPGPNTCLLTQQAIFTP